MSTEWMPEEDVIALLRVPPGSLSSWRKAWQRAGLQGLAAKFDHQEKFKYTRRAISQIHGALLTLGKYGRSLHGAEPLLEASAKPVSGEADGNLIAKDRTCKLLGVSAVTLSKWSNKQRIGGPRYRKKGTSNLYQASDVAELRAALLVLGRFEIGLPNYPPLKS